MPTLNESFTVPNADQSWAVISDLNKLVPCVPGAKVLSADSPKKAQAEITVKMGSMGMVFTGPVEITSTSGTPSSRASWRVIARGFRRTASRTASGPAPAGVP